MCDKYCYDWLKITNCEKSSKLVCSTSLLKTLWEKEKLLSFFKKSKTTIDAIVWQKLLILTRCYKLLEIIRDTCRGFSMLIVGNVTGENFYFMNFIFSVEQSKSALTKIFGGENTLSLKIISCSAACDEFSSVPDEKTRGPWWPCIAPLANP